MGVARETMIAMSQQKQSNPLCYPRYWIGDLTSNIAPTQGQLKWSLSNLLVQEGILGYTVYRCIMVGIYDLWPDLRKPGIFVKRAYGAMRVFSINSQKISKSSFCHIYVKEPFY